MIDFPGEIILDTCLLEPPEPFIQAMDALQQMQSGQFLHMLHRRKPRLLYPELPSRGLTSHTYQATPELFHILIWSQKDDVATTRCQQLIQQLTSNTL